MTFFILMRLAHADEGTDAGFAIAPWGGANLELTTEGQQATVDLYGPFGAKQNGTVTVHAGLPVNLFNGDVSDDSVGGPYEARVTLMWTSETKGYEDAVLKLWTDADDIAAACDALGISDSGTPEKLKESVTESVKESASLHRTLTSATLFDLQASEDRLETEVTEFGLEVDLGYNRVHALPTSASAATEAYVDYSIDVGAKARHWARQGWLWGFDLGATFDQAVELETADCSDPASPCPTDAVLASTPTPTGDFFATLAVEKIWNATKIGKGKDAADYAPIASLELDTRDWLAPDSEGDLGFSTESGHVDVSLVGGLQSVGGGAGISLGGVLSVRPGTDASPTFTPTMTITGRLDSGKASGG